MKGVGAKNPKQGDKLWNTKAECGEPINLREHRLVEYSQFCRLSYLPSHIKSIAVSDEPLGKEYLLLFSIDGVETIQHTIK